MASAGAITDSQLLERLMLPHEAFVDYFLELVSHFPAREWTRRSFEHGLRYPWTRPERSYLLRDGETYLLHELDDAERAAHPRAPPGAGGRTCRAPRVRRQRRAEEPRRQARAPRGGRGPGGPRAGRRAARPRCRRLRRGRGLRRDACDACGQPGHERARRGDARQRDAADDADMGRDLVSHRQSPGRAIHRRGRGERRRARLAAGLRVSLGRLRARRCGRLARRDPRHRRERRGRGRSRSSWTGPPTSCSVPTAAGPRH